MDLREYESIKFELAAVIRSIGERSGTRTEGLERRLRDLSACLAEDRFNLVVMGRFNRGKSSLMNAILGTDRLPTGLVPLTSVITRVIYGSAERARVEFRDGGLAGTI